MKVISIIAQKGGATKTTLAIHLAVEALSEGKEVMIIDLDPQASATKWKDLRESETPLVLSAQASRLEQTLEKAKGAEADLVIIDTPPHSNDIALKSAKNSDLIIIPTKTGILDLQTVPDSLDIAKLAGKPAVIVLSAVQIRGGVSEEARGLLESLGAVVSPFSTGYRVAYSNAPSEGKTAQEYEPTGKASEEVKQLYKWIMSKVL